MGDLSTKCILQSMPLNAYFAKLCCSAALKISVSANYDLPIYWVLPRINGKLFISVGTGHIHFRYFSFLIGLETKTIRHKIFLNQPQDKLPAFLFFNEFLNLLSLTTAASCFKNGYKLPWSIF